MKRTSIIKGLVLFSSLSLVTLFLLYRIDYLEKASIPRQINSQGSPNSANMNLDKIDTTKKGKDSSPPVILPSSKVIILTDKNPVLTDSLNKTKASNKIPNSETDILSSSKSTIIFKPQKRNQLQLDTVKLDILKKRKN